MYVICILVSLFLGIVGCTQRNPAEPSKPGNVVPNQMARPHDGQRDDDPFADLAADARDEPYPDASYELGSRPALDNPETYAESVSWTESGNAGAQSDGRNQNSSLEGYRTGDLVPCTDESGPLRLEVEAMSRGECWYRMEAIVGRYDASDVGTTSGSRQMFPSTFCAMFSDGFAIGTTEYVDPSPDSVSVAIEWNVSRGDNEQAFAGTVQASIGQTGSADAGDGNEFKWSLLRHDGKPLDVLPSW